MDFEEKVKTKRHLPAILIANIGTTMKEGKDDIKQLQTILDNLKINERYIHCDAVFCGSYAQFLFPKPHFDFSEGADSIIVSGHKFIGSPIPCGIVIVLKQNKNKVSKYIHIIDNLDDTINGSRNAIKPLIMWYAIKTQEITGLRSRLNKCLELTAYAVEKIEILGIKTWRNPNALTIILPLLSKETQSKWQLASHGGINHIIIKPGITKQIIDSFVVDLKKENSFNGKSLIHKVACCLIDSNLIYNTNKIT
ncbi:pyridoxal-dependent decarboxylase [Chryseobacterium polytrichastri]|uniref:Pyridoxal-dependent decarboxylase conserved domain-containing protein n=1 Tax=Chryseobacterium polytrichastri TaxID=1302687 RepID=A0A1M7L326_9FLAO|nr:pyridoxal-dependent decarboxylase [Chryseobacterium polytrichastri]SHM72114.1 Pyridoxal-dependent decarboxylase conserved domain-containing protein [Chryseobacterium polytrichastri]